MLTNQTLYNEFTRRKNFTYVESFVGSGADLIWILDNFPKLENDVIYDINADLIKTYLIISSKSKVLISILQNEFHNLDGKDEKKKEYYCKKRELYNTRKEEQIRLRFFCSKLEKQGQKWMFLNSNVKGKDTNDNFIDERYSEFSITRVKARISINANHEKRGELGGPTSGRVFRFNLLFVLHKRLSTSIPKAKLAA